MGKPEDLFIEKNIAPMLISRMQPPFDHPDWIYELKLDGCRCVAYLEKNQVVLRNKRNMDLLPRFPELKEIYKQTARPCILDGELVVLVQGVPEFYELQKRTLMTKPSRIELSALRLPAAFVAYDCLQAEKTVLYDTPLLERKKILQELIRENERIAVSRYLAEQGTLLFQMTVEKKLEGVVAKRSDSLYYPGKRTKDWIKFKRMADREFLICGYVPGYAPGVILGEYKRQKLSYAGSVSLGVRKEILQLLTPGDCPFTKMPVVQKEVVWCKPKLWCTVEYMPNSKDVLRQPVFKGIREEGM